MPVKVAKTIDEMKKLRAQLAEPVGFVPTMGYLHEGHLSLVRRAKIDNPSVIVSIFVNPTQFGPKEDFKQYPRDTERDLALLEKDKTDVVFMPSPEEMYPPGSDTWVEVGEITRHLEGASRPSHFRGVTTVVAKLFNIVEPTRAYFGQKDAQQAIVITKMATDLNMNLEVITLTTVREPDGLAMSSRNIYLNPEERKSSVVLSQALSMAQELFAEGEADANIIRHKMTELIQQQPLANIDYISIADAATLNELDVVNPPAVISLAVNFGTTRLIDNIIL